MEYSQFGLCGLLFLSFIYQVNCNTFNTKPSNQVVLSGEKAVFNCSITFANTDGDAHRWQRLVTTGATFKTIFQSFPKDFEYDKNKFTIHNPDPSTFNLIVNNVDIMDAGTYSCTGIVSTDTSASAELVVIERPVVSLSPKRLQDGDQVTMMCDVKYACGKQNGQEIKPKVKVMLGKMDITNQATIKIEEGDLGTEPASRISLSVNQTARREQHGDNFTCQATTNTPRFQFSQNETFNIRFPVQIETIKIEPLREMYYVGDSINCTAEGHPEPNVQWIPEMSAGARATDDILIITEQMIGEDGLNKWSCQASNTPKVTPVTVKRTISFTVLTPTEPTVGKSTGLGSEAKIAIGVVIPVVAIIVIIIVICCICKKKKQAAKTVKKAPEDGQPAQPRNQIYRPVNTSDQVTIEDAATARYKAETEVKTKAPSESRPRAAPRNEDPKRLPHSSSA